MSTSSKSALVGYTGFVGSNLDRQHSFEAKYNSTNIEEIAGGEFEELVFAGAQAKKWWANANPEEDWANIERALRPLQTVSAKRVVLISTVDAAPKTPGADETSLLTESEADAYGSHRLRLEERMRNFFDDVTVVRLPGLFGVGLKKNVIYDLLNGNQIEKINPESRFQYYSLETLWRDIGIVREAGIRLMHFATEPIQTREILQRFFPEAVVGSEAGPVASYDFRTCYGSAFGQSSSYIASQADVLEELESFISNYDKGSS